MINIGHEKHIRAHKGSWPKAEHALKSLPVIGSPGRVGVTKTKHTRIRTRENHQVSSHRIRAGARHTGRALHRHQRHLLLPWSWTSSSSPQPLLHLLLLLPRRRLLTLVFHLAQMMAMLQRCPLQSSPASAPSAPPPFPCV